LHRFSAPLTLHRVTVDHRDPVPALIPAETESISEAIVFNVDHNRDVLEAGRAGRYEFEWGESVDVTKFVLSGLLG